MLKMYAKLLLEMLTNREADSQGHDSAATQLERLQIEPDLKCILYECLQAEKKTLKMEEDRYQQEIAQHIEKEASRARNDAGQGGSNDLDLVNEFKELVAT